MESTPLPEWLQTYSPQLIVSVAGGLILLLILLWLISKLFRKRTKSSGLLVHSFQLAPLGRDAFLKITNPGDSLTLLDAKVIGRNDVVVKNEVAGQQIPTSGSYSILLEAGGERRLDKDFSVQFTFVDEHRHTYHHIFSLNPLKSVSLKRKR